MDVRNGSSVWMEGAALEPTSPLDRDPQADVCVVGAGIAGLTTAYLLASDGKSVVVLDDGAVAGGETSRTTAHLTHALDDRYCVLERLHGEDGARLAAASHSAAIDTIEQIVRHEKIDCDFERVDGYLVVPSRESTEVLREELALAHRAGLEDVAYVARVPCASYDFGPALRFPHQAQLHAVRYMNGLARAFRDRGGRIHTAHATSIEDGTPARVETADGVTVAAGSVIVATNSPVNNVVTIHTKQAAYRTYVIGALVPAGSAPRLLLWDTADPYHYVRLANRTPTHDVLIVGGEDHKTGQATDFAARYERLEQWTRARFPIEDVAWRWSGQVLEPNDGLAFIGRNPHDKNVFVATGDSGNGMTHGTIAGRLLSDLVAGRENAWADLYEPSRITLRAAGEFARETLNFVKQYADVVTGGDVDSVGDIPPGCGAVVRRGLHKLAVYRDENDQLQVRSAVCTHLGCIVQWNQAEKTWDCPCHGSRFATDGHAVNGPAVRDLGNASLD